MKINEFKRLLKTAVIISRSYGFDITEEWVLSRWTEPHRFYHTPEHLFDVLSGVEKLKDKKICNDYEYDIFLIASIFHDIVYEPKKNDNEEKSVELMLSTFNKQIINQSFSEKIIEDIKNKIINIILGTKTHENNDDLCEKFNRLDTMILDAPFIDMLDWEKKIYQEYEWVGWKKYKQERIKFLLSQIKTHPDNTINIKKLIEYIDNKKP